MSDAPKPQKRFTWPIIAVAVALVCAAVLYRPALTFVLALNSLVGNGCPAWYPSRIESEAKFQLPPSTTHLESFCTGMQGFIAGANFEMDADELDVLLKSTAITVPLSSSLPKSGLGSNYADDPVVQQMVTLQFGTSSPDWPASQIILIDTSDSDTYVVYLRLFRGN